LRPVAFSVTGALVVIGGVVYVARQV